MNAAARQPDDAQRWVAFSVDGRRFALSLESVERVVRAAEYTPLPLAPEVVLGALDIAGDILPVFSLRRRFRLTDRPLAVTDQFVIARAARRRVVLAVDAALGLVATDAAAALDVQHVPELPHLRGAIALPDGMLLIQDLERFLSPEEADALDTAMRQAREASRAR